MTGKNKNLWEKIGTDALRKLAEEAFVEGFYGTLEDMHACVDSVLEQHAEIQEIKKIELDFPKYFNK